LAASGGPIGIEDAKRLWDLACDSPAGISVVKWNAIERIAREFNLDPIADVFLKSAMKTGKDLREKPAKPPRGDNANPKSVFSRFSQPAAPREKVSESNSKRLRRGQLVSLGGFARASDLNGRRGRLQYYDELAGTWIVHLKGDEPGIEHRIDSKNIRLAAKPAKAKPAKRKAEAIAPEPQPTTMPEDPEQAVEFLLRQMEQAKSVSQVERLQKRMHSVLKGKGLREDMIVEVRGLPGEDDRNGSRVRLIEFDMATHWAVRFEDSILHGHALQHFPSSKLFKPDPCQDAPPADAKAKCAPKSTAAAAAAGKLGMRMKLKPFANTAIAARRAKAEVKKDEEPTSRKAKRLIAAPMLRKERASKSKLQESGVTAEQKGKRAKSQKVAAAADEELSGEYAIPVDCPVRKGKAKKTNGQVGSCPASKKDEEAAVAAAMKEAREAMVAAVEKVAREAAEAMIDRELSTSALMKRPASATAVVGAAWEAAEKAAKLDGVMTTTAKAPKKTLQAGGVGKEEKKTSKKQKEVVMTAAKVTKKTLKAGVEKEKKSSKRQEEVVMTAAAAQNTSKKKAAMAAGMGKAAMGKRLGAAGLLKRPAAADR